VWTGSRRAGGNILTVENFSIQNGILCTELTNATELMLVAYLVKKKLILLNPKMNIKIECKNVCVSCFMYVCIWFV
jgi:hypothetical protein